MRRRLVMLESMHRMNVVYSTTPEKLKQRNPGQQRKVLITGAAGRIGSAFAEARHEKYDLRLAIHPDQQESASSLKQWGEVIDARLEDLPRLKEICQGVDTVVHLAANPAGHALWKSLLKDNIEGTYNLMVAAKAAGCRRVIYASSVHAVFAYPEEKQVSTDDPVSPGDLYGVSKCFGEALGRYMALCEDLSVIGLRIGGFDPYDQLVIRKPQFILDLYVSPRDLFQLMDLCIEDEKIQFALFNGISNNRNKRLDISDARQVLGYTPLDDSYKIHPKATEQALYEKPWDRFPPEPGRSGLREDL